MKKILLWSVLGILLLALLIIGWAILTSKPEWGSCGFIVENVWLGQKLSLQEIESKHMLNGIPFGIQNSRWQKEKAKINPGDEIREFSTSNGAKEKPYEAYEGVVVLRTGTQITCLTTQQMLMAR